MLQQRDARAIVQMIAQLSATLGMRTVCEGVESAQQLAVVAKAEPLRLVPETVGTKPDSVNSFGRSNGGSSWATRWSVSGRLRNAASAARWATVRLSGRTRVSTFGAGKSPPRL